MNILIINHNGGSLYHGPNLRTYYAAKELVNHGHRVVIASSSYSHKYSVLPNTEGVITQENIDGIHYRWIRCINYRNLFQRIYSHFEFGFKLVVNRLKICTDADLIIFSGPPPEIFLFSWIMSRKLNSPIVSDMRDLWPRTQLEMNKWQWLNPYTYFLFLCQFLLVHGSSHIISPLPGIHKYLYKLGRKSGVVIIENGIDLTVKKTCRDMMLKVMAGGRCLKRGNINQVSLGEIRRTKKFIVGYSGAFDRDNDIDSLLAAAKQMSDRDDIMFMFVGDGIRRDYLLNIANQYSNILICARVNSQEVISVISVMDVCFCGLRPKKIYQYGVSLAKSFEYMSAGKPVLWMVDSCNNLVRDSGGGIEIEAGNTSDLVRAIEQCALMDPNDLIEMGRRGYKFIEENNSYKVLGAKWAEVIGYFDASNKQ